MGSDGIEEEDQEEIIWWNIGSFVRSVLINTNWSIWFNHFSGNTIYIDILEFILQNKMSVFNSTY